MPIGKMHVRTVIQRFGIIFAFFFHALENIKSLLGKFYLENELLYDNEAVMRSYKEACMLIEFATK